ncbi:MAG TPA: SCO family protein, partial [Daejeonella sp.]|nr:SCO family protein [Daejeonella sp.]
VAILALPGLLYYLLQEKGKNRYRPLPIFGPKEVAATFHTKRGKNIPDTIYHQVQDFGLVNQDNQPVSFSADNHKITVVNFFFTRCTSFCKGMNQQMLRVGQRFQNNRLMQFYSITVDPEFDTPEVLKKYSVQFAAKPVNWQFLTGDKAEIYQLSKEGFLLDALQDTTQSNHFIHTAKLVLLDAQKRIRGYYDANSKEQVDKLIDEIKVLITEQLREEQRENKLN